jgi:hypothetical protein
MEKHRIPKKDQQQIINCTRWVGKPRKQWEDGVREDVSSSLAYGLGKLKPKIQNSAGNA